MVYLKFWYLWKMGSWEASAAVQRVSPERANKQVSLSFSKASTLWRQGAERL